MSSSPKAKIKVLIINSESFIFFCFIFRMKLSVKNSPFKIKARSVFVGLFVGEDGFEPPKV